MPRSIEHIVDCHDAASALRAAGKPIWSLSVPVGPVLRRDPENTTNAHAAAVALEILGLLRAHLPANWLDIASEEYDRDLDDVIDGMALLTPTSEPEGLLLGELNHWLSDLYDWADRRRIWLSGT